MTLQPRPRTGPFIATALAACAVSLVACDSTATIYVTSAQFSQLQVLSAYPAQKQANGSWERVCGTGPADGIMTNVVFQSTQRGDSTSADVDLDLSIRPRDVIQTRVVDGASADDINLSNPGNLAVNLGCINPANLSGTCQGAVASATLDAVRYAENTTGRDKSHNVMILIDQSGSNNGLVQDVTYKEQRSITTFPENFRDVASDRDNVRTSVARRLLRTLNSSDQPGVLAFGEQNGLVVPCALAVQDVQADLQACFGARNRGIWDDQEKGLDSLPGKIGGRSNMWLAVKTAYDFLKAKNDRQRSNHIVVLTDGPDTCAGENRTTCETPCSTADFATLSDQIESDHNDPNAPKIHVHFIQFEALGYPGRDARQVELSCVSGGHYQFINSNQFSRVQTQPFQDALDRAVTNVRYALMGHWELSSSVPVYASNAGGGAGVPAGNLYGLEGQIVVRRSANLTQSGLELTFPFGFGISPNPGENNPSWDRRPTVRKPCGGFADCGAASAPGACQTVCSPEALTCASGATPATLPDLAQCSPSAGVSGFCCEGDCQTAGNCAVCN